ncbi:MAG TPA: glycosyltransferase, partial [bacterium]|nr:glycosyltransferase [bacterium]
DHEVINFLPSDNLLNRIEHYLFNRWRWSWTFKQVLIRNRVCLIHAHFAYSGIFMVPLAKKLNIPLIVTLHGNDVAILLGDQLHQKKWALYKKKYKELLHQASLFLADSQELKDRIVEIGCPAEKVIVHTLGIDLKKFPYQAQKPSLPPRILMVGRFVEKKGFIYGIRAFAAARKDIKNAELHIIGDGELRTEYEAEARSLGVASTVFFHGVRPHEEIVQHMHQAALFLAPSVIAANKDRDSGLIVAKEAAACGLPVIGSIHGGIPDIIADGETGFLIPERDVIKMSQCIVEILNNPELWSRMSIASRKKIEEEYNIEKCNERSSSIYDELLKSMQAM